MAGLYIHIPFCHSKCIYCDFYSTPKLDKLDALLEALVREYDIRKDEITEAFRTVYIGGGTPSIVPPDRLAALCSALPVESAEEFTIEANPEDIRADIIKAWRETGINRVSMGVQSFDDEELLTIRRRHNGADAMRAIETLLDGGISNISCDLIYGLPGQSIISWERSLDKMLSYGLPHLSAYCLSYEAGTALHARMTAGKITPTDDEILEQMYLMLCDKTSANGYEHYEISNFAKEGMRSQHNSSYWTSTPYIGLGPGAHSFDGTVRRYNPTDLNAYIKTADITIADDETDDERFNDLLITSLRTADGLRLDSLDDMRRNYLLKASERYINDGIMIADNLRMRIEERSWFRSDAILRDLIVV